MDFSSNAARADKPMQDEPQVLKYFAERMEGILNDQAMCIHRIAEKLHDIKNLRSENVKEGLPKVAGISDYSQFLEQQIGKINENNGKLYEIENHLTRII
jgi:hypothetical protein